MKKLMSTIFAFVMLATTVFALPYSTIAADAYPSESGTLGDGQSYTYDSQTQTLSIEGSGRLADYKSNNSPFLNCTIKNVVVGEGITYLGAYLFKGVKGVDSFSIPSTLTSINKTALYELAFDGNGFTVNENNTGFCSVDGSLYSKNIKTLYKYVQHTETEFAIPQSVSKIVERAITKEVKLDKLILQGDNLVIDAYGISGPTVKHIEINEGVKSISAYVTVYDLQDSVINLPSSVSFVDPGSFVSSTSVESIKVSKDNATYIDVNGVLIKKSDGTVIIYPKAKQDEEYITPIQAKAIGYRAFDRNENLKRLIVSNNVKSIASNGIYGLSNLEKLTVVNSECEIKTGAIRSTTPVLCAKDGSLAQAYASSNSFTFEEFTGCVEHIESEEIVVVPPQCEAEGEGRIECVVCGEELSKTVIKPTGHTPDKEKGVVTVPPTCKYEGEMECPCSVCGQTVKVVVYQIPHGQTTRKEENYTKPTCTKDGGYSVTYYCNDCGDGLMGDYVVLPKTGHSYKTTTTKATTSKNGSVVTKCTVCGAVKSKSTINYAKTISLSTTKYTYDGKYKKPSVTVKDSKGNKISTSNYSVTYSNNKYVGKASVKITFKGNYSGTKTLYFTINPKGTIISSISGTTRGFKVTWKKQATQTTGYQIQYSTSSKFTNPKTVIVTKNSTTSKTISKLTAKKKYYVRVRTYKTVNGTKYYSAWSVNKTVTTKA